MMTEQLTIRPRMKKADRLDLSIRIEELLTDWYLERRYQIDEYLAPIITLIAAYWANDPYFENCELGHEHHLSLRKSLCLAGPPGCSKTTLFEASNYVLQKLRLPVAFAVVETKDLASAFEHPKTGGISAIKTIIGAKHARHLYYDEIGKRMIAQTRHYATEGNMDILTIEFREDVWRQRGLMLHSTTNMSALPYTSSLGKADPMSELEEWLTGKYISRFRQISNILPISNRMDYRTLVPTGRRDIAPVERPEDKARAVETAQHKHLTQFVEQVQHYHRTGEYRVSNETIVYDILLERDFIPRQKLSRSSADYEQACTRAAVAVNLLRSGLDRNTDKGRIEELRLLLDNLKPGSAHTTQATTYISIAAKAIWLERYVREELATPAMLDEIFPKE